MVVGQLDDEQTDRLFHAMADRTRRDILRRSMHEDFSVSSLADLYPMSFAAVQKHVAVLEAAGLVTKRRDGRKRLVRTNPETVHRALRALEDLETMWRERIDRFTGAMHDPTRGEHR